MKKDNITIGTFCRDMNIEPSKLRYYESMGLIQPARINETNGYHYYSYEQYGEMERIKICRKLNIPIKSISQLKESQDQQALFDMIATLKLKARKLMLQQQEIYQNLLWLHETMEQEMQLRENTEPPQIQCVECPERRVILEHISAKEKTGSLMEQDALLQYKLCKTVSSEMLAVNSIQQSYGYQLHADALRRGELSLSGKFVELPQYVLNVEKKLFRIPGGTYLTMPAQVFLDTTWMELLLQFAQDNHYRIQKVFLTEATLQLIPKNDAFYTVQAYVTAKD